MIRYWRTAVLCTLVGLSACRQSSRDKEEQAAELAARAQRLTARLASADKLGKDEPAALWIMPEELAEISGIALMPDGRLLAHDDEVGRIYEIDQTRGVIVKRFTLKGGLHGDFEGITFADGDLYMIRSDGKIYQFKEGTNGSEVPYTLHDTKLGKECEFEGVAYEADSAWLVMPCKTVKEKDLRDQLVIYRWRLHDTDSTAISRMTVPLSNAIGSNSWKNLRPSDITIDPATGNYVLIASQEKALIEMTPDGDIVRSEPLPGKHHQAEGVAITKNNILIISDEATSQPASISLFPWRPSGASKQPQ